MKKKYIQTVPLKKKTTYIEQRSGKAIKNLVNLVKQNAAEGWTVDAALINVVTRIKWAWLRTSSL